RGHQLGLRVIQHGPRVEPRDPARPEQGDPHRQPLTPVSVTPSMNTRWARKKTMMTGSVKSTAAAMSVFQGTLDCTNSDCIRSVRKNCLSRKIENASPKKEGTMRGVSEPIQCKRTKMTYRGTIVTWAGSMRVASTSTNATCRPRHRIRESA